MYDEYGNLIEEDSVETPIEQPVALPPKLLDRYKKGLTKADHGVDDANSYSDNLKYANTGIGILNDFTNSQKSDIVLKNRMADLGRKPNIIEADRQKWDRSILDNMGKEKVSQAEKSRDRVDSSFKSEAAMEDYGRKAESEMRRSNPNSEESAQAREYLKRIVPGSANYPGLEKMSAAQVEKIAPGLYKKYADDEENKLKRMAAGQKQNPVPTIKDEMDLSKDYQNHPVTKATNDVATSFEKVKNAASNPSAAGDLSLIFGYMKMLDPGSTVREGEFATAQNAAGVPTQAVNMYNRALNGERLAPTQRADFISQAGNIYNAQMGRQAQIHQEFSSRAAGYGLNPGRAFGTPPKSKPSEKTGKNNVGRTVNVNGIDYKVGDDGDTLIPLK